MNRIEANAFATSWIRAWNKKDVDAVLDHYVEDATFISPKAATGAIAIAYNLLEFCMRGLFNLYSIRDGVFTNKNNFERLKIIREAVDKSSHPDAIKKETKLFVSHLRP
jgi:hypothetical protein